jgi:hypothetical protein
LFTLHLELSIRISKSYIIFIQTSTVLCIPCRSSTTLAQRLDHPLKLKDGCPLVQTFEVSKVGVAQLDLAGVAIWGIHPKHKQDIVGAELRKLRGTDWAPGTYLAKLLLVDLVIDLHRDIRRYAYAPCLIDGFVPSSIDLAYIDHYASAD